MARLQQSEADDAVVPKIKKQLDPARPEVVELSEGLADMLHLASGGQGAMLVNSLSGQANALDVTVGHTFNTGNARSNDKFAFMTLDLTRTLLDAEGREIDRRCTSGDGGY